MSRGDRLRVNHLDTILRRNRKLNVRFLLFSILKKNGCSFCGIERGLQNNAILVDYRIPFWCCNGLRRESRSEILLFDEDQFTFASYTFANLNVNE